MICIGSNITFENGANIDCSFVTNLENAGVRSAPILYKRIKEVQENKKTLPKYQYPDEILIFSVVEGFSKYGVDFKVDYGDLHFINALDNQKQYGKKIFGGGFLMSQNATQKRLEAEKEKQYKNPVQKWTLSDREKFFTL